MGDQFEIYLHEMGLSEYETSTYLALLQQGTSTAKEVSNTADIPQSRIYDVLDGLDTKGFVTVQNGRPKKFGPIEPPVAVRQYRDYKRQQFNEHLQKVEDVGDRFLNQLEDDQFRYKNHDEFDIFWSYEGKNYLLEQFGNLCSNTTSRIRLMTMAGSFDRIVNRHKEILHKRNEHGVEIQVLLSRGQELDDAVLSEAEQWAEIRPADNILGRIYLFDSDRILLAFRNNEDTQFVGLSTHSEQLYVTLSHFFNLLWDHSNGGSSI